MQAYEVSNLKKKNSKFQKRKYDASIGELNPKRLKPFQLGTVISNLALAIALATAGETNEQKKAYF